MKHQLLLARMMPKIDFFHIFLFIFLLFIIWWVPFDGIAAPAKLRVESATSTADSFISHTDEGSDEKATGLEKEHCDLFTGEWIPNPEGPYYTNETCHNIYVNQNCIRRGKPDTGYSKWRWKPDGCDLPIFDPQQFLQLLRGKSIAFVGDSMNRNHIQSLGCLLSRVAVPVDVSSQPGEYKDSDIYWVYKDYKFNMAMYWAPFLVRAEKPDQTPYNIYLDAFDQHWTSEMERYSIIVIAAGQWYISRRAKFYENGRRLGCHGCEIQGVTEIKSHVAYRKALRTALKAINMFARPEGMVFLRTISPTHFENGSYDSGGNCLRKRPYKRNETVLAQQYSIFREIQLEEFKTAQEQGRRRGLRYALLDVTEAMLLRPDGHPGKYGRGVTHEASNDCMHWCLPGPVDIWNDLFLQLLLSDRSTRNMG